jgi:hypothetical protein
MCTLWLWPHPQQPQSGSHTWVTRHVVAFSAPSSDHNWRSSRYKSLIISLVISRLDYGNSTLYGPPSFLCNTMQSVLKAAATSVFRLRRYEHFIPALVDLHCLRVPERVWYKVATLVNRCLHGLTPQHLTAAWHRTVQIDSICWLRSDGSELLIVPLSRLITMGDRSFPVAGPRIWNSLPHTVNYVNSKFVCLVCHFVISFSFSGPSSFH